MSENPIYNAPFNPFTGDSEAIEGRNWEEYICLDGSGYPDTIYSSGAVGFQLHDRPQQAGLEIRLLTTGGTELTIITTGTPDPTQAKVDFKFGWVQLHPDNIGLTIWALYDSLGTRWSLREITRLVADQVSIFSGVGTLGDLLTTLKDDLVVAVNELFGLIGINTAAIAGLDIPIITEWVSVVGGATFEGIGSNPTKATTTEYDTLYWRRVGDTMEVRGSYRHTNSAGAADGAGGYLIKIPDGQTIDIAKADVIVYALILGRLGTMSAFSTTAAFFGQGHISVYDSTRVYSVMIDSVGVKTWEVIRYPFSDATISLSFNFAVPIVGWT